MGSSISTSTSSFISSDNPNYKYIHFLEVFMNEYLPASLVLYEENGNPINIELNSIGIRLNNSKAQIIPINSYDEKLGSNLPADITRKIMKMSKKDILSIYFPFRLKEHANLSYNVTYRIRRKFKDNIDRKSTIRNFPADGWDIKRDNLKSQMFRIEKVINV